MLHNQTPTTARLTALRQQDLANYSQSFLRCMVHHRQSTTDFERQTWADAMVRYAQYAAHTGRLLLGHVDAAGQEVA